MPQSRLGLEECISSARVHALEKTSWRSKLHGMTHVVAALPEFVGELWKPATVTLLPTRPSDSLPWHLTPLLPHYC